MRGYDGQQAWRKGRERFEQIAVGPVEHSGAVVVGDVGSSVRAAYDFDGSSVWVHDGDARFLPFTIVDGAVVVGSSLGDAAAVRAIDPHDGSVLWDAAVDAWGDGEYARDAVAAAFGAVAVGTGGRVAAVDLSGRVHWSRSEEWDTHGPSSPSLATDGDTAVAAGGAVAGFDAATGDQLWRHVLPDFATGVTVGEGLAVVTVAGDPPKVDSWEEPGGVLAYDLVTGEERWRRVLPSAARHPAADGVYGEFVDVATDAGDLWRLDADDGEPRWRRSVGDRVFTPVTHEYPYCVGVERDGTVGILGLGR